MVIPLLGRLSLASRKEGLLPECCRGNLYAKQTGQKLSKKTRANAALCDLKTEQMPPPLFYRKRLLWSSVITRRGTVRWPRCSQPADAVALTWDTRRDPSGKVLFRGFLLLCSPASTVNPGLNISVPFFVYPKLKRNRRHSRWSPKEDFKEDNTVWCVSYLLLTRT